ncbi:PREDICTED: uncharacterized protein LOC105362145 [Ceratosolen solmsi marchali]|uniref:Uncharacterized protein LOC105362145 n=1 Tax=Ceratosolen solmsi marchali TaxID=326594 RepID=A0AAJ6YGT8_9HYME|nr:PREDICTED: uncharacterized protein LOC105362145 [Ceratosolen solmsi marchali]
MRVPCSNDSETLSSLPEEMIPVQQTTEGLSTKTIEEGPKVQRPTSPLPPKSTSIEGNQLSQPDTARKTNFNFDDHQTNFRVIVSPKTDYVKTTHKGGSSESMSAIPIDVAAMIVVGAIVSIGLTSVAALMIFHMRSRLLKTALSIYNHENVERQLTEKDNTCGKDLAVTIGTFPRTLTRINPVYNASSDASSAILRFNESPAEYANSTVTIGVRLSSNLRDLLESQYDRPASCSHRSAAAGEMDVEHVYDEIPFSPPFHFEKDT